MLKTRCERSSLPHRLDLGSEGEGGRLGRVTDRTLGRSVQVGDEPNRAEGPEGAGPPSGTTLDDVRVGRHEEADHDGAPSTAASRADTTDQNRRQGRSAGSST